MRVHLIRHPTPAIEPGICYGRLDVDLAANAQQEIDRLLAQLPRLDALVSSAARRCLLPARQLAARDALEVRLEPQFAELDFGDWEKRRWDAIDRAALDAWAHDPWRVAPPGGETYAQLSARTLQALERIAAGPAQQVAVFTHGGSIRAALAHARGTPQIVPLEPLPCAAVFTLERSGGGWRKVDGQGVRG
jgi:alpha-ribazole phosphatase